MPNPRNILMVIWWTMFTLAGLWLQRFIPGVDVLAPGIILSLQKEGGLHTFWLAVVWILLQEGMGSLPFGYGVAWYGALLTFYVVGRWLFEGRSVLFMLLLGIGLGTLHPILSYALAGLANLTIPFKPMLIQGAFQAVLFPVIWLIIDNTYPRRLAQDVRPL